MKFIVKLLVILSTSVAANANPQVKQASLEALDFIASVYSTTYSPAPWKKQFDNWDIELEYEKAKNLIEQDSELTIAEAKKAIMGFVYSMRDYHVSIRFHSTEQSALGFTVRSAEGRYFIVHVDRTKLSTYSFPFEAGDEIIEFDGKPVDEVVQSLKIYEANVKQTDQALAELALTLRRANRGYSVPRGPIVVSVKPKNKDKVVTRQLIWEYTPELVPNLDMSSRDPFLDPLFAKPELKSPMMNYAADTFDLSPQSIGDEKGFLPDLGEVKEVEELKDSMFRAYVYKEGEETVGVVRIPSYSVSDYDKSIESFEKVIAYMEENTDKLVIDQLNNPGGSVFYLYALASNLSDQALATPKHKMSITPSQVANCASVKGLLEMIKTDQQAVSAIGKRLSGFPVSLQFVNFYKGYCELFLEEWAQGKTMSTPHWIAGVDKINPNITHYTKPILILINELDFSGGDFFPTIMQDNNRATIMGVRTAGAGGYVLGYSFPNLLGISNFRVTESLAYRVDQNPIENLGVTPDIEAELTVNDLQNNYVDYVQKVKAAVRNLK
ncbi:MAG: protease-like activity factor CPAF [Bdellovibrionota bacterium]|nr:protease-like activity factor CPAF [Bdellovibrionota bacterium]